MLVTSFRAIKDKAVLFKYLYELLGSYSRQLGAQAATSITVLKASADSEGIGSPAFLRDFI